MVEEIFLRKIFHQNHASKHECLNGFFFISIFHLKVKSIFLALPFNPSEVSPEYLIYIQQYYWLLVLATVFFVFSIVSFEAIGKPKWSVASLMLSAFSLLSFIALADPFVQIWDESFHALVAKNLQHHFLKPTLIENPLLTGFTKDSAMYESHIWLHKQPLFLWQIALSFKLFGVSLYTLRLPSIIMFSLLIPVLFRMGKLFKNEKTGFYAAVLFLSGSYLLQLTSGRMATDHNDVAFIFYVTLSFWAWFEYRHSGKIKWLYFIGLFSGAAILVKWLTGLLVFSGWGLSILFNRNDRRNWQVWKHLGLAAGITTLTFLPWQLYTYIKYPELTKAAYALNNLHLKIPVHGHVGTWSFHFEQWDKYVGPGVIWVLIIAALFIAFSSLRYDFKIAGFTWILIVQLFFMLVPTKMAFFTFIVAPITSLFLSYFILELLEYIKRKKLKKYIGIAVFASVFLIYFDFQEIKGRNPYWNHYVTEAGHFKQIKAMELSDKPCFFNFYYYGDIRFQFLTGLNASAKLPTETQISEIKRRGISIYIFDDGKLPEYILADSDITKVKAFVWPSFLNASVEFYH